VLMDILRAALLLLAVVLLIVDGWDHRSRK
jgi:hypothetical protein